MRIFFFYIYFLVTYIIMTSYITKTSALSFNSNPVVGAQVTDGSNGSRFSVRLEEPLHIPQEAVSATMEVISANIWYTSPNISPDHHNNNIYFFFEGTEYALVIPSGLYNLLELVEAIRNLLTYSSPIPPSLFKLEADYATNKVTIILGVGLDVFVDNVDPHPNNVLNTLGFTISENDSGTKISGGATGAIHTSDTIATLNQINSYLIHASIAQRGITVNNRNTSILAEVQLDAVPNSQIRYRPFLPVAVDASLLQHGHVDTIDFWLTDEQDRLVDTNGEYWQFTILFKYLINPKKIQMQ
jgi:hypothetical protein